MALTHIAFGALGGVTQAGGSVLALRSDSVTQEAKTPTGTSAQTTVTAGNYGSQPMARIATDTAVYVSFGSSPNASSDTTKLLVPAGGVEYVSVKVGDKCAVVTA